MPIIITLQSQNPYEKYNVPSAIRSLIHDDVDRNDSSALHECTSFWVLVGDDGVEIIGAILLVPVGGTGVEDRQLKRI